MQQMSEINGTSSLGKRKPIVINTSSNKKIKINHTRKVESTPVIQFKEEEIKVNDASSLENQNFDNYYNNDYYNYNNNSYVDGTNYNYPAADDGNLNTYNYNYNNNGYVDSYQNYYNEETQYDYNQFPSYPPPTNTPEPTATADTDDESEVSGKRSNKNETGGPSSRNKFIRKAAGRVWEDCTLAEWSPNDFRIFVGNLGNEVTDDSLKQAFSKYPSFAKAKVIRDKRTMKTKGYGFVSFLNSQDFIRALKEMNGKYICNRPCKLTRSRWSDRSVNKSEKKQKKKLISIFM